MKSPNVWCFESPFTDGMPYAPHWTQWRSHRNPCPASRRCSSRSGSPTAGTWIVAMVILLSLLLLCYVYFYCVILIIIMLFLLLVWLCYYLYYYYCCCCYVLSLLLFINIALISFIVANTRQMVPGKKTKNKSKTWGKKIQKLVYIHKKIKGFCRMNLNGYYNCD